MSVRPSGAIAVVTGAARGLGRAFSERLGQDGAVVVCVDTEHPAATVESIVGAGGAASAFTCDVSSPEAVAGLRAAVLVDHGRCDVLVNNAGIYPFQPFETIEFADWRRVMSINVDSMFLTCAAFVPGMRERGWGRVVNMASDAFGSVLSGVTHYTASKGAVIGLTRALATEVGPHGVTVNSIAPGLTRTPGTLARREAADPFAPDEFESFARGCAIPRVGEPEDVAGVLAFLVSDDARYVTGQTIWVDGGRLRS